MTRVLCINPGSTSTKLGVFDDDKKVLELTVRHSEDELKVFDKAVEQFQFRKENIVNGLKENEIDLGSIDVIACRGGLIKPIPGGVFLVNDEACDLFRHSKINHPCNLASLIGKEMADELGIVAYFVDSPSTYELDEIATYSGLNLIERKGNFHALNHKAIARLYADEVGKSYEDINVIVAHLGGGMSIAAHKNGLAIDTTDGDEEGPFTPDRSGDLPTRPLLDLCFSGEYTYEEIKKLLTGKGGLISYLGINDMLEATKLAETDEKAKKVVEAMAYQISKAICSMSAPLKGNVDAILLTGGIAYSEMVTEMIKERVGHIAEVKVYPGERELEALAEGALRVVNGKEDYKTV